MRDAPRERAGVIHIDKRRGKKVIFAPSTALICTLADIQNMGYEVILVSSGAIAVGRNKLNMHEKPDSMRMKQAAAAVGQCSLMYLYDKFFGDYDKTVAQILLNAEDIEQEEKKET